MENSKIFSFIIISIIFLFLIFSIGGAGGKVVYEKSFCGERFNFLTNYSTDNYWIINHEEPFNHACCTEAGRGYYKRESGTLTYFLLGSSGSYMKDNCEWLSDEQQEEYNPPNKIVGTFKFLWHSYNEYVKGGKNE